LSDNGFYLLVYIDGLEAYAMAFAKEGAKVSLPDIASADPVVKAIRDMGGTAISHHCRSGAPLRPPEILVGFSAQWINQLGSPGAPARLAGSRDNSFRIRTVLDRNPFRVSVSLHLKAYSWALEQWTIKTS